MVEPTIDPTTGKPVAPGAQPPPDPNNPPDPNAPQVIQIDKKDWDNIKQRLDAFEAGARSVQPAQPAAPAPPPGPTFTDQVKEIDGKVADLNVKIDAAVKDGNPVAALLTERDELIHKRTRLQIKHEDIDPAMQAGIQTIDLLSDEVTRGSMVYLKLPDVKKSFDVALQSIPPEQRMNPKMRKAAYDMAVGQNIAVINEAEKEEILRSVSQPADGEPPAGNSRTTPAAGSETVPKPKEVLSPSALAAIRQRGITVDQYYQKLGYKDWNDFYEKRGKEYFGDEEEAA